MIKTTIMIAAIMSIGLATVGSAYAESVVTNDVTIQTTCAVSADGGIDFGTLEHLGVTASESTIVLTNTGTALATVSVSGTNWLDSGSTNVIAGSFTKFATSDQLTGTSYDDKTSLNATNGAITMGTIAYTSQNSTYWMLNATLNTETFSGALSQDVTFEASC